MKSFKQFLTEEYTPENMVEAIARDCQPYLNEVNFVDNKGTAKLFRGMKGNSMVLKKQTRINRQSLAMPEKEKEILDDAMMQVFGYPFRSKVAFTSGNSRRVELFGSAYIIFPIGNFTYLWSPEVDDLNENDEWTQMYKQNEINHDSVVKFLKERNYMKDKNLIEAIDSGNEVMIGTEEYYAIDKGFFITKMKEMLLNRLIQGE